MKAGGIGISIIHQACGVANGLGIAILSSWLAYRILASISSGWRHRRISCVAAAGVSAALLWPGGLAQLNGGHLGSQSRLAAGINNQLMAMAIGPIISSSHRQSACQTAISIMWLRHQLAIVSAKRKQLKWWRISGISGPMRHPICMAMAWLIQ